MTVDFQGSRGKFHKVQDSTRSKQRHKNKLIKGTVTQVSGTRMKFWDLAFYLHHSIIWFCLLLCPYLLVLIYTPLELK